MVLSSKVSQPPLNYERYTKAKKDDSRRKLMCGVTLITIPSIQYGRYFLLRLLSGGHQKLELKSFRKPMFRAGHAHAGMLFILSLIGQLLADERALSMGITWFVRIAFPAAAILISGGFFSRQWG